MGSIEDNLEHIYEQLFHKIEKTGTETSRLHAVASTNLLGEIQLGKASKLGIDQ